MRHCRCQSSVASEEKATVQVRFQMSGGFGGLFATAPLSYEASTDDLPRQEADLLRRLVEESGLLVAGQRHEVLRP